MRAFSSCLQWHLDEIFVKNRDGLHYLWRAVDYEGDVLEGYVTRTRDRKAMRKHRWPEVIVPDRLRSYCAVVNEMGAEIRRETGRRRLIGRKPAPAVPTKGTCDAPVSGMLILQKLGSGHASICSHLNPDRILSSRTHFSLNRTAALSEWRGRCAG